ncbi:hypothetical protein ACIRJM_19330 [Streptomyces sp. NPDC102405]|uniref:hypothetical protein n=1 Tax=Streptomyces sp. NPDC102405 TaxID=3366170 RepID=UPI0037F8C51F
MPGEETQTSITNAVCDLLTKMRVALALVDEIHNQYPSRGVPEIVVLTHLILGPPTSALDPKALYLATTAVLSRRFARIYTIRGRQDPLCQRFCRAHTGRNPPDQPSDSCRARCHAS